MIGGLRYLIGYAILSCHAAPLACSAATLTCSAAFSIVMLLLLLVIHSHLVMPILRASVHAAEASLSARYSLLFYKQDSSCLGVTR